MKAELTLDKTGVVHVEIGSRQSAMRIVLSAIIIKSLSANIPISVENVKSACRFAAAFPPFFWADARIGLQKTTGNPLKNQLRIFLSFCPQRV